MPARRRLAARAYRVGRALRDIVTIATRDTLLRLHRHLMGAAMDVRPAADDGVRVGHRVLIGDRDRKWSRAVRRAHHQRQLRSRTFAT
jgi:hypothetical protein